MSAALWRPRGHAAGGTVREQSSAARSRTAPVAGADGLLAVTHAVTHADGPRDAVSTVQPLGTLWLTGLSGSGKTTIAHALAAQLRRDGVPVEVLDGDELREHLSPGLGFSREDRDAHVTRVGYLARLLARHGVLAIVPVIAPYGDARERVRAEHEAAGIAFRQVYVATPLAECARRDVKGLYAAHSRGEVSHLTGVDDPYEEPANPDLIIDTTGRDVAACARAVAELLTGAPAVPSDRALPGVPAAASSRRQHP